MRCKKVIRLIPSYLDEELTATMKDRVNSHLQHCRSCRSEAEQSAAVRELLMSLPEPTDIPDIVSGVRHKLSYVREPVLKRLYVHLFPDFRYQFAGTVAVVMIFCFTAGFLLSRAAMQEREPDTASTLPLEIFATAPPSTVQDAYISLIENGG